MIRRLTAALILTLILIDGDASRPKRHQAPTTVVRASRRRRRPFQYYTGEMTNGTRKLREDTWPRGMGRCFVDFPLTPFEGEPYFLDNGAFIEWNRSGRDIECDYTARFAHFESRLPELAELTRQGRAPQWIVIPDRPGHPDSLATSAAWLERYERDLAPLVGRFPLYLPLQDGMTIEDLQERPRLLAALSGLFLGGTDAFKLTAASWTSLGLPVHFARCTQRRIAEAIEAGCVSGDSAHPLRLGGDPTDPETRWGRFLEVFDAVAGPLTPDAPAGGARRIAA